MNTIKNRARMIFSLLLAAFMLPVGALTGAASEERVNLALHKPYTIRSDAANDYSGPACEQGGKDMLTDGEYGDTKAYYSGKWAHFVRAFGRSVTVDLGAAYAVDTVKASFIQHKEHGVYCPQRMTVYYSENGIDFQTIDNVLQPVKNTQNGYIRAEYISESTPYKARYVRIHFDVQVNLFIDEIEIYGNAPTGGEAELKPDVSDEEEAELYYDNRTELGVRDIMCFHNGYHPDEPETVNNTREIFKPYIGYVDASGNYADTMFDAIMFLTAMGRAPSGGSYMKPGGQTLMSDWEYLLDNTFGENINVCALDAETAEMKKQLALPESYKVAVYLTAPYPKIGSVVIGDLDVDGTDDMLETFEDCVDAYMWYVRAAKARFDEQNFENVELKGFFWLSEGIDNWDNDYEVDLAYRCVKEVQAIGLQVVFIPSWQAPGSEIAHDVGFDAVIMQPNLSFNEFAQRDPKAFMQDFIDTASKYHFGIQLEMMDWIDAAEERYLGYYEQYLRSAVGSGMMTGALHAYYQGAGRGSSFFQCAKSSKPRMRWLYDCTYKFIKGTLTFEDGATVVGDREIKAESGKLVIGSLGMSDDSYNSLTLETQAEHGTAFYYPQKGQFSYRASKSYVGEDVFTLKATFPDGREELVRVTVDVTSAAAGSTGSTESAPAAAFASEPSEGLGNGAVIGIAAAALAVAGGVTVFLVRIKKKNRKQ